MICLKGDGRFDFDVVGESAYQTNLALLAGPRKPLGVYVDCLAVLAPQDDNPHDPKAVIVGIARSTTRGLLVGYLPKAYARKFRAETADIPRQVGEPIVCRGLIVGGWDDGIGDVGLYGVKLDLRWPLALRTSRVHKAWMKRLI